MTSDVAAEGKHRFWMLDLLRGASAILVLVYHSSNAFPVAYAAVDLFFMLSGFVLAERYGESLLQAGGRRDFINHRIARLYPVYFACTLLGAVFGFPIDWPSRKLEHQHFCRFLRYQPAHASGAV